MKVIICLERALAGAAEEAANNSDIINFRVQVFKSSDDLIWQDRVERAMKEFHAVRSIWGCSGSDWERADTFIYLEKKDGWIIVNDFGLDEDWMKREGLEYVEIHGAMDSAFLSDDLSNILPFQNGDLVMLDAPVFSEPITGVMMPWGGRGCCVIGFIWQGKFETYSMNMDIDSYERTEYRPVDWLHFASESDLPAGLEVLKWIKNDGSEESGK